MSMLAKLGKLEHGYIAEFERPLKHSIEEVWEVLTVNEKLEKWFPNLHVSDLRKDGVIKFNMNDGTGASFDIKIIDYQENSNLEYEWGDGRVRFELSLHSQGCTLVLKEYLDTLNDHTPKDLAGWHVCLNVMSTILNGNLMDFPKGEWEKFHEQYINAINQLKNN